MVKTETETETEEPNERCVRGDRDSGRCGFTRRIVPRLGLELVTRHTGGEDDDGVLFFFFAIRQRPRRLDFFVSFRFGTNANDVRFNPFHSTHRFGRC